MRKLLLASGNPGKLEEMRALLDGLHLELVTPQELDLKQDVHESGESYVENAAIKAMVFSNATGMVTLADDLGLEVDALGGLPGIRSARFSPLPGASDADRRAYLLERLSGCRARGALIFIVRSPWHFQGRKSGLWRVIARVRSFHRNAVRTALDMIRSS